MELTKGLLVLPVIRMHLTIHVKGKITNYSVYCNDFCIMYTVLILCSQVCTAIWVVNYRGILVELIVALVGLVIDGLLIVSLLVTAPLPPVPHHLPSHLPHCVAAGLRTECTVTRTRSGGSEAQIIRELFSRLRTCIHKYTDYPNVHSVLGTWKVSPLRPKGLYKIIALILSAQVFFTSTVPSCTCRYFFIDNLLPRLSKKQNKRMYR